MSERQAEAIDALITALDIMVGLHPYLHSIRQASYDPDIPRGTGDPVAIRLVIEYAREINVARMFQADWLDLSRFCAGRLSVKHSHKGTDEMIKH